MRKTIFFIFAGLQAANVPVAILGTTQTQVVLGYTATTTGACTFTLTPQGPFPVPVYDIDTTKRTANANSDLGRTVANGYRFPSICGDHFCSGATDVQQRIVVLGGHAEMIDTPSSCLGGINCKGYSTALQVASPYSGAIACNGGADTGTFSFTTKNLPLGQYYPEMQLPVPGHGLNRSGYIQPWIDVTTPNPFVVDPITGIYQQLVSPFNSAMWNGPNQMTPVTAIDVNGAAWTTPLNVFTNQNPATLATTSTQNAPLFVPFPAGRQDSDFQTFLTDFTIQPYGSSTNHTEIAEFAISLDSGQHSMSFSPIDVTYSNVATSCQPSGNCTNDTKPQSSGAGNLFSGWGGLSQSGQDDLTNKTFGGVNASGSTITIPSPTIGSADFKLGLLPGSKFTLTGCSVGSVTNPLTVASVQSASQLTVSQVGLSATGCTYTDLHAGITVTLKSAGTLNVSFNMFNWQAQQGQEQSDPERWYCSRTKDHALTNCDGTTNSAPGVGVFMCFLPQQYIYAFEDNGQTCKQTNLWGNGAAAGIQMQNSGQPIHQWINANQVLMTAKNGTQWIATHGTDYTAMPNGSANESSITDRFTYAAVNFSTAFNTQLQARGGPVWNIANFLSGGIGFDGIIDNGAGVPYLQFRQQLGQNTGCVLGFSDYNTNTLIGTINMLGDPPFSYSACHFGPQGTAGNTILQPSGNGFSYPASFSTATKLGGPFKAPVMKVMKNGTFVQRALAISAATNASPAVLTSTGHNLSTNPVAGTGDWMQCSGATDVRWNGTFYAHLVDNNTFQLFLDDLATQPLNSTTFGAIGPSYVCNVAPPVWNELVSATADNGQADHATRVTMDLTQLGFTQYFPSGVFPGTDADPVCFGSNYCAETVQYYIKKSCTACASNQVDIYKDAALTIPAPLAEINALSHQHISYAELCPDPATVTMPFNMINVGDTGFGSAGAPMNRCVTIETFGHLCSSFPAAGEVAAFPCPDNAAYSMLHDYIVGDGLFDQSHEGGQNHEVGLVVKVAAGPDSGGHALTYVKNFGNQTGGQLPGQGLDNLFSSQHAFGWTVLGSAASIVQTAVPIQSTASVTQFFSPGSTACTCHCEAAVPSKTVGNITTAFAWSPGCNGGNADVVDGTLAQWAAFPVSTGQQAVWPRWAGGIGDIANLNTNSYPSHRQVYPTAVEQDMLWKTDLFSNIAQFGSGQNAADGFGATRTITNVSGDLYLVGVAGSFTGGAFNGKLNPYQVQDLPNWYFQDKSGPGSTIVGTGADDGKFCVVYITNQCVNPSTVGSVYVAMPTFYDPGGCQSNDSVMGGTCAESFYSSAGWFAQFQQRPFSVANEGVRLLTKGWWEPPGHYEFFGMTPTPDGLWDLYVPMPWNMQPRYKHYIGNTWWRIRNPPFQQTDGIVRSTFYNLTFQKGGGTTGDTVRASCGYGEDGDPSLGHCSTYNEQCFSSTAATATNPYVFASETQNGVACASGCNVTFPAIPGRVAYCRLYTTNGASTVAGPVQVLTVP